MANIAQKMSLSKRTVKKEAAGACKGKHCRVHWFMPSSVLYCHQLLAGNCRPDNNEQIGADDKLAHQWKVAIANYWLPRAKEAIGATYLAAIPLSWISWMKRPSRCLLWLFRPTTLKPSVCPSGLYSSTVWTVRPWARSAISFWKALS